MTTSGIQSPESTASTYPGRLIPLVHPSRFRRADLMMIGTMVIWGINITCVKVVVKVVPPLAFGLIRYTVAGVILFALLRFRESTVSIRLRDLPGVAAIGVIGFGFNQIAFLLGVGLMSASMAAIVLATAPLMTAALAAVWAREPLRVRNAIALITSFAGVAAVIASSGHDLKASWLGGILMICAALTLGLGAVMAKRPLQSYSSMKITAWMCVFGSLTLLPFGGPALATAHITLSPVLIAAATFTVLGSTVAGNLVWNYAVQQLGAARTSTYTYLQPVAAVVVAAVLLGERLTIAQIFGAAIVLAGLLIYTRHEPAAAVRSTSLGGYDN